MKVFDGLVSFLTDTPETSSDTRVPPVYVTTTTSVLLGICLPDTKCDAPPYDRVYDRTHNTQNLEYGQWWEQGLIYLGWENIPTERGALMRCYLIFQQREEP